jgi:hypothetical protein
LCALTLGEKWDKYKVRQANFLFWTERSEV